jgi:hypothetical protein
VWPITAGYPSVSLLVLVDARKRETIFYGRKKEKDKAIAHIWLKF